MAGSFRVVGVVGGGFSPSSRRAWRVPFGWSGWWVAGLAPVVGALAGQPQVSLRTAVSFLVGGGCGCGGGGQPQVSLRTAVSFLVGVGVGVAVGSAPGVVAHGGVLSGRGGCGCGGGVSPRCRCARRCPFWSGWVWVWRWGQPQVSLRTAVSFLVGVGVGVAVGSAPGVVAHGGVLSGRGGCGCGGGVSPRCRCARRCPFWLGWVWVWRWGQPQVSLRTAVSFLVGVGVGVRWGQPQVSLRTAVSFLLVTGRTDESGLRPRCRSRRLESVLVGRMWMSSEISGQNILTHCGSVVAVW